MSKFTDEIELMHTYWAEGDEVHSDLDKLEKYHNEDLIDERAKVIEEVVSIVKAKISEKEYLMDTMVELTDLGSKIQKLNNVK